MIGNFLTGLGRDIRSTCKKRLEVLGSSVASPAFEEICRHFNRTDLPRDGSGDTLG